MIKRKEEKEVVLGLSVTNDNRNPRELASYMLKRMIGIKDSKIHHKRTGRPFITDSRWDISLSHKERAVFVGAVCKPYRVGVDIEYEKKIKNLDAFCKHMLCNNEKKNLRSFCQAWSIPRKTAALTIWTIKESFCKCADLPLIPQQIEVKWEKNSRSVHVEGKGELLNKLKEKKLLVQQVSVEISNGLIRTVTIMVNLKRKKNFIVARTKSVFYQ